MDLLAFVVQETQNFVFDPSTDTTTVAASDPNYPSDGSADALNFVLYGAAGRPRDEPDTGACTRLWVIGLVLARRRAAAIFRG